MNYRKADLATFYGFVFAAIMMDIATAVVLTWQTLSVSENELQFGLVFLVSILTPYLIKRSVRPAVARRWSRLDVVLLTRLIVFGAMSLVAIVLPAINFVAIGILFFCICCIDYITMESVEGMNIKISLFCGIDALDVARWMQATVQIAVFSGNLVGGVILKALDFRAALITLLVCSGLASAPLLINTFRRFCSLMEEDDSGSVSDVATVARTGTTRLPDGAAVLIFMLASIGLHVALYNFTTPILFQKLLSWSSLDYGICSAFGGIGALSATFFKFKNPKLLLFSIGLFVGDAIFVTSSDRPTSFAAALLIGFSLNSARIAIRARLTNLATDRLDADLIASSSAFAYFLLQATGPLLATLLVYNKLLPIILQPLVLLTAPILLGVGVIISRQRRVIASRPRASVSPGNV